jgi:hypothetical protein
MMMAIAIAIAIMKRRTESILCMVRFIEHGNDAGDTNNAH